MATQILEYVTSCPLNCGDLPAEVILCVPSDITNPEFYFCGEDAVSAYQSTEYDFINADIQSKTCLNTGCGTSYLYQISYNDLQLLPETLLTPDQIQGIICRSCLTKYIDTKIGSEPYIYTDVNGVQNFVSPHGCVYPIDTASLGFTVDDTDSVDLTLDGTLLTADVNISANDCNAISIQGDGLFVAGIQTGTTESTVTNLTTVDGCNFIDVDVRVSEDDFNNIEIRADGLYSESAAASLFVDTASSGNIGTTSQALMGYALPGGTLSVAGDGLEIHASIYAPTTSNKTLYLSVGGQVIAGSFSFTTVGYIDIKATVHLKSLITNSIATAISTQNTTILGNAVTNIAVDFSTNKNIQIWASSDGANDTIIANLLTVKKVSAP